MMNYSFSSLKIKKVLILGKTAAKHKYQCDSIKLSDC